MQPPPASRGFRLPLEPFVVLLVGAAIYAARIDALTLRGEEPRRALVAHEMATSGRWFVPTQQGLLFADRPPLGAWLMAASARLCGEWSPAAVRLPTILGVIATGLILYGYARRFTSGPAAVAAACIYFTFGQVLQLGRFAECEGLFVALMAASLLGWHAAYADGRPLRAWLVGYTFAALAGLVKGPQGPVYFATAVGAYLIVVRRDPRCLFSRAHAAGLVCFALTFGAWLIPFWLQTDVAAVHRILFGLVTTRLGDDGSLARHIASYPLMIAGALLPWSPLLLRYASRSFRRELGPARDAALFCAVAVGATFPSVWFAFGAVSRHFMSMYPCFAVLAAIVVDRSTFASGAAAASAEVRRGVGFWRHFARTLSGVAAACAIVVALGSMPLPASLLPGEWSARLAQPLPLAIAYCLVAGALAAMLAMAAKQIRHDAGDSSTSGRTGDRSKLVLRIVGGVTVFLGFSYTGLVVNSLAGVAENTAASVARAKSQMPADARLVSLGELDPLFLFHFREPIELRSPADFTSTVPPGAYFALNGPAPPLPFEWDAVATVSCERNRKAAPLRVVEIGRRRPASAMAAPLRR